MMNVNDEAVILGVFDGHGGIGVIIIGNQVSSFCAKYFSKVLTSLSSYREGRVEVALKETFLKLDEILKLKNVNEYMQYNAKLVHKKLNQKDSFEFLDLTVVNSPENKHFSFIHNIYKYSYALTSDTENKSSPIIIDKIHSHINSSINKTSRKKFRYKKLSRSKLRTEYICEQERSLHLKQKIEEEKSSSSLTETNVSTGIYYFGGLVLEKSNQVDLKQLYASNIGSTANVAIIKNGFIYIANVGDSLAVSFKHGQAHKLNSEHNLDLPSEKERIRSSGTYIIHNRIEGRLNLTRALGDFNFKSKKGLNLNEQPVIVLPEINKYEITRETEFILMGTDGLWDCVDIQKLCENISWKLKKGVNKKILLNDIFDNIISKEDEGKIKNENRAVWFG
jgi:serine/threonine protein phosphatase PrpC